MKRLSPFFFWAPVKAFEDQEDNHKPKKRRSNNRKKAASIFIFSPSSEQKDFLAMAVRGKIY